MTRGRSKEFRKVRKGAVMLHWTVRDAAEYQSWLSRQPISDRTTVLSMFVIAFAIAAPIVHHHNFNHHVAHGAILKH